MTFAAVGVLALVSAAAGQAAKKPPVARLCPLKAIVAATLKQRIVSKTESVVSYSDGQGIDGSRRTCTYLTGRGTTITVILSAGAQVLGFVDAEDAALGINTGYQSRQQRKAEVVPVFGRGNDAWALKGGGSLSALYKTDAIVIDAPHTTVPQLVALAQATLGIPSPNAKGV
jgi:hypothetical protein